MINPQIATKAGQRFCIWGEKTKAFKLFLTLGEWSALAAQLPIKRVRTHAPSPRKSCENKTLGGALSAWRVRVYQNPGPAGFSMLRTIGAIPESVTEWNLPKTSAVCPRLRSQGAIMDQAMARTSFDTDGKASSLTRPAPIRAVFVIQKLAGLSGGAERVFVETAEAMAARGISVRLVTLDPDPTLPLAFGCGGVPVASVFPRWLQRRVAKGTTTAPPPKNDSPKRPLLERLGKAIPNVLPLTHIKWQLTHGMFERALAKDLRRAPADVIVAFLPPAIASAARAGARLGIPVIASTHNVPDLDFGDSNRWDQNPLYRARARSALASVACVTVLQPDFLNWFSAEVRPKVTVMPNPVSRLCELPTPPPRREPIVLGVGRLTGIKRWDLLIEAFAVVAASLPDWSLRIFGVGPEQNALQARVAALGLQDRVAILPPKPEIGKEYDRASILVHPSEFEGFGLSVAEAMAHGLPVVAFADCAGVNDLIEDNRSGLLVERSNHDRENVRCLANVLVQLAKDPDRRCQFGSKATAITQRFDRAAIHDKWAQLLRDVRHPRAELE